MSITYWPDCYLPAYLPTSVGSMWLLQVLVLLAFPSKAEKQHHGFEDE
jgi:hypothetical protein